MANLSKEQQAIYRIFKNQHPRVPDSNKAASLKYTHLNAQYQISLEGSDDTLLKLLPPEPSTPTAGQIAVKLYQDGNLIAGVFKVLLPFIIYDLADPQFGRLPQCDRSDITGLNEFESLIVKIRRCIIDNDDPSVCKEKVMMQTQYDDTTQDDQIGHIFDQFGSPVMDFLGIASFRDFDNGSDSYF